MCGQPRMSSQISPERWFSIIKTGIEPYSSSSVARATAWGGTASSSSMVPSA